MNIEMMKVKDIKPYARNAKKHGKVQIDNVAESIRQFGFTQPLVVDKDGVLIIGHCRLAAAKKLKLKEVPCVCMDELSEEQVAKLRLLDNKLNESDWDFELLADEIEDLDFDGFELDWGLEEKKREIIEDEPPEPDFENEPTAKRGDIYQCGRHRVMCGDSTSVDDLKQLLNGKVADLLLTDPPYNMNFEGAGNTKDRESKKIMNDHMSDDDFEKFLQSVFGVAKEFIKDGASFYVFYKELGRGVFITSILNAGLKFKQELIWVKNQLVLGGSNYQSMYEPCLYGCKGKRVKIWNGKRKQRSVIESVDLMTEDEMRKAIRELTEVDETDIIRENKPLVNDLHPTMKPIKLLARFVYNSSNIDDAVLDIFGGSGSTMIACQQLDRSAYLMELDPRYVDVIVKRWEDFTGEKAVRLNGERTESATI